MQPRHFKSLETETCEHMSDMIKQKGDWTSMIIETLKLV